MQSKKASCASLEHLKLNVSLYSYSIALKELMPAIISQAGPQQYEFLKKLQEEMKTTAAPETKKEGKTDEEIPDLVSTNFEEVSNKS